MSDINVPSWLTTLLPPTLMGAIGYFTARLQTKSEEKAVAGLGDDSVAAAVQADLSRRYRNLFDGYERHIRDLTTEIETIRDNYERRILELTAEIDDLRGRVEQNERRWRDLGSAT